MSGFQKIFLLPKFIFLSSPVPEFRGHPYYAVLFNTYVGRYMFTLSVCLVALFFMFCVKVGAPVL
jgi:hypothetical protein